MISPLDQKETILLRIKSSNSSTDMTIPAPSNHTVKQLKDSIQNSLGQSTRGRYVRLIFSGRLLAPDNAPISNFQLKDGSVIHAVVAAEGVRGGQQAALSRPSRRRRLRGAGVGSDGLIISRRRGDEESDEDDEDFENLEAGIERIGFDRLRANGLSRSEISALRTYFSSQIDSFMEQRNSLRGNEGERNGDEGDSNAVTGNGEEDLDPSTTERIRRSRLEDEWMETQGPHTEFRLNLNASNPLIHRRMNFNTRQAGIDPMYAGPLGNDKDFIWGFVLGYFIGFMMMFWVWMPTVPHRQKLGILTGICFHMGVNIMNNGNEENVPDEEE
mmetsp:Transcript_2485/g.3818  ORF Transcript_2485/g.3818 Transcript_2485/m.3818 type:complete len:329 (+) Transcript_2485:114-1100(+)